MYCVNCKLIHFYIYAKIDNLGNVLHQLNIILHSQIPKENSANQFQQILQRFLPKNENAVPSFGNCCSVTKSFLTLWPHELKHARLPCPSLCPRICSNSCPLSWWWYPTISLLLLALPVLAAGITMLLTDETLNNLFFTRQEEVSQ